MHIDKSKNQEKNQSKKDEKLTLRSIPTGSKQRFLLLIITSSIKFIMILIGEEKRQSKKTFQNLNIFTHTFHRMQNAINVFVNNMNQPVSVENHID